MAIAADRGDAPAVWTLPTELGMTGELARVRACLDGWLEACDPEVHTMVARQLAARAKYFRPVTLFACHRAMTDEPPSDSLIRSAAAIELIHNVTLIVDDILDRSRYRRGELSLHCRFGSLPALMVAGYLNAGASTLVAEDPYAVRMVAELMQRLGVAECFQWRLRRHPLGVEDWRRIAGEDTGAMFEICARLGVRDDRLRRYGLLLGILYHGCDDVADVRGTAALGGGSEEDICDGIVTLPAAIAIRDPGTAALFRLGGADAYGPLVKQFVAALPAAESVLDEIAAEASEQAQRHAPAPEGLVELVRHTRALSRA